MTPYSPFSQNTVLFLINYSGVWFQSEGFDTNTILCEKSIIEYVHLPLDNEKKKKLRLKFLYKAQIAWHKEYKKTTALLKFTLDPDTAEQQWEQLEKHAFDPDCRYVTVYDLKRLK